MTDGDLKQDSHSLKDTVAKRYFGQREVFADLCNAFLFRQPGRLDASKLRPMPTEYNELILNADGKYDSHKRERDLAFQAFTDGDRGYALLCAEFQSTSDNTMPVRIMLYDALGYAYQLKSRLCSEAGKVLPISTIVVNIGSQEWRGPKSLHGMFPETDDFVGANVPDYPIKVFDPYTEDVKILDSLCTDLKSVSYLFRFSDRGDLLSEKYQDDSTSYLGGYGIDLVNVCLNMGLEVPEEGRRLEMCKAVEDLKAIGRDEGIQIGIGKGRDEGIQIGIGKGRDEGIQIGIGKGRTEGIETVAANALKKGMPPNVVEEITGLPPLRIMQIAQEIRLAGIR